MPIRWDAPLARAVADELEEALGGGNLRAVRLDGAERDLFLLFRECTLIWRLHPSRGHVMLLPPAEPGPSDLRHAARVRRIAAPPDERVIRIELLPKRSGPPRDILVELMGNQWNAVVTEAESRVIRHVLWSRKGTRGLAVGRTYTPPSGQSRAGTDRSLPLEQWMDLLSDAAPDQRARVLIREVAWTSPLNAPALLACDVDGAEDERLREGHRRWRAVARGLGDPVLLQLEDGPHPYPMALPGRPGRKVPSLLGAFQEVAGSSDRTAKPSLLDPDLVRRLEEAVLRAGRRARQLEAELNTLEDGTALRAVGDLILARYREVPSGTDAAVLRDFNGGEQHVELDPKLTAHENAARYYDRAARVERAERRLPGLVDSAEKTAASLRRLLVRARAGEASPEEVETAIPARHASDGVKGTAKGSTLPYRTFRSSGGLEIRVGRGAKHNDDLTFRHSAPHDVWLHARHAAGAHVILRWDGPGNPPARDLAQAAALAALHSKARTSGSVPVDWTLRKYVRKPRGAPRGTVIPDRVSTLFVRPDPALEEALDAG
jgi:predicted ribosome quality control (RQC) complex YloA/Tae2 family protein